MPAENPPQPSFSPRRRIGILLNVVLGIVAAAALIVMVNYLGAAYYKRLQWTTHHRIELSPQTTRLAESLTNQVEAIIFFDVHSEADLYGWVSALLREYQAVNPKITVRTLDYARYPGNAELVLAKYKLSTLKDKNFIIFDCEGRSRIVYANQLADYDINGLISGKTKEIRRTAFRGEMLFSAAIFGVAYPKSLKAYFVHGHGEHNPDDTSHDHGYGKFAAMLRDEHNAPWERLSLQDTNDIPADCQLLVIAGPSKAVFADSELEKIDNYLRQGGRLLALLNNPVLGTNSGLEKVLGRWGVAVGNSMIVEDKNFSPTGNDLLTARLDPQHPVVKSMFADELRIRLVLPRAVGKAQIAAPAATAPKVDVLAATSDNAAERFFVRGAAGVEPRDRRGSFPLIAAVEQGSIKGVTTDRGTTRIIAVGDALCLDNQLLDTAANHYFAGFAIDWLLDRPQFMLEGIGPQPVREYRVLSTKSQMKTIRWVFLAGMPGAVLLMGGLVWLRRRS
jgi:hypothetical protein